MAAAPGLATRRDGQDVAVASACPASAALQAVLVAGCSVGDASAGAEAERAALLTRLHGLALGARPLAIRDTAEDVVARACREIGHGGDVGAVARSVAAAAREALGARAAVTYVRSEQGGVLEAAAFDGVEPSGVSRVRLGRELPGWAALREEATWVAHAGDVPAIAVAATRPDRGVLQAWMDMPVACLPIATAGHVLGLVVVAGVDAGCWRAARPAMDRLVDKAAASLAGARMLQQARRDERVARELEIVRQIQRSLLPSRAVSFDGLDVAGECRPAAQVGGDWFGLRATTRDRLVAGIFDVAGHGIGAAFCMTLVRSALQGEIARGGDPALVLDRANALVWEDLAETGLFATAFLARLDRARGTLAYSSAGHSRPIHWSAASRAFVPHVEGGLPLGLFPDSRHPRCETPFGPGDVLVLYTDGIVEAGSASGAKLGRDALMGVVHRGRRLPARGLLRALWREVEGFTRGERLRDDATLVVIKGRPGFGGRVGEGDGA